MADNKTNDTAHEDLKIEPALLDQIRSIVERRDFVQDLMKKASDADDKVKPTIRAKVIADYDQRLQAVMTEFEPVCKEISKGLAEIEKKETEIRTKLEEVNDEIEEQRFRCELGEFNKDELEPLEKEKTKVRDELEEKIKVIEETYEECKKYISHETFEEATKPAASLDPIPVPVPDPPAVAPEPQAEEATSPGAGIGAVPPPPEPASEPEAEAVVEVEAESESESEAVVEAAPEAEAAPEPAEEAKPKGKKEPPPPPEPEAPTGPRIKLVNANGEEQFVPLNADKTVVGRHQSSDIVLRVAGVSRKHAEITRGKKGELKIQDVSSGGGFSINGKRKKEAKLKGGDVITIGPFRLEVFTE